MATAAEQVLGQIQDIKKSLDEAKTEKAQLKAELEKSHLELGEVKKSFEDHKKVADEQLKSFQKLDAFLKEPDYTEANPYKIFAQAKEKGGHVSNYNSLGEFCVDVREAEVGRQRPERLKSWMEKASSLGLNETIGSEGAFLVPPEFNMEIWKRTYDNPLLKMTQKYQAKGNELNLHGVDETSRANGSRFGGVQMYWESEAASFTSSKPAFNRVNLKLKKLIGLCYVTEELLSDAPAMQSVLTDVFAEEAKFKVGDAILNGSGAGQPLGWLNSSALVSVSKETGQAAATILKENIEKMWARLYAPCREKAVWLMNQDIEPALAAMTINVGTGGAPVYMPPGGMSDKPYGTLKGRPCIATEFNASLGTVGDLMLVDMSQYVTLNKGDVQTDSSIHFKFDTAQTAFRMFMRIDGAPRWLSALTPFKGGSNTQSACVALSTRA